MAVKRCKYPHEQQTALTNGKPARPQTRSPFGPGVRFAGSRAAAPRFPSLQALVAIPAAGRTYLPSPRLRGRRQSHRPRPRRRRRPPRTPPAAAPEIAFICGSRSHKMALREETRPRRQPRPASSAPRPECAADTPPVAHSPETRLSGAASVTVPGASGQKRRGEAGPLGVSGRGGASGSPQPHRDRPRRFAPAPWGLCKLSRDGEGSGRREGRAREVRGHPRGITGRRPLPDTLGGATCGCSTAWAEESEPTSA